MEKHRELDRYITLKLTALGLKAPLATSDPAFLRIAGPLLRNIHQKDQLLAHRLCPVDARIQPYLDTHLAGVCPGGVPRLPSRTFAVDVTGLSRELSFPPGRRAFSLAICGVLPRRPRRAAQPAKRPPHHPGHLPHRRGRPAGSRRQDRACPSSAFARAAGRRARSARRCAGAALHGRSGRAGRAASSRCCCGRWSVPPPATTRKRPWRSASSRPAAWSAIWISSKRIFGNARRSLSAGERRRAGCRCTGPATPAASSWRRISSGCARRISGLPHFDDATERQRRDGMCWRERRRTLQRRPRLQDLTCRDHRGVMVTIIADNYYGYCKKEVKTQISYAANLFGLCEEEHAGGAIAFPAYVLGQEFYAGRTVAYQDRHVSTRPCVCSAAWWNSSPRATRSTALSRHLLCSRKRRLQRARRLRALAARRTGRISSRCARATIYVLPVGLPHPAGKAAWRHRLATGWVASPRHALPQALHGFRRRQVAKFRNRIANIVLKGPVFVSDYHRDMDEVAEILTRDFSAIYRNRPPGRAHAPADPEPGAFAGLRDQAADAVARIHGRAQRRGSAACPQTIRQLVCHGQALLPARMGRQLARALHASTASTATWVMS